jgi:hypothetical protein
MLRPVSLFAIGLPISSRAFAWQRGADGTWRLHRDIWSIDPPAQ